MSQSHEVITQDDLSPEDRAIVQKSLKSLRRYVLFFLIALLLIVLGGALVIIFQGHTAADQLLQSHTTTQNLLHGIQHTLNADKQEILNNTCKSPG